MLGVFVAKRCRPNKTTLPLKQNKNKGQEARAGDQLLVAKETARQLSMGTNILEPHGLPDFKVGEPVPKDLGDKYGEMCYNADGFAQVRTALISDLFSISPQNA